jgi:hypothetical protein
VLRVLRAKEQSPLPLLLPLPFLWQLSSPFSAPPRLRVKRRGRETSRCATVA